MRKQTTLLGAGLLLLVTISGLAQNGCPDCTAMLPDTLPADTIFLSDAPDGRVNERYEGVLHFRMPRTTTPVAANDPTVAPGLTINEVTIVSVSNLPPGMTWQANQTVFRTAQQTDGCVTFCGRPLQPGLYEVEVVVRAQVLVVSQTTSFSFPILIEPAIRSTEGFTMTNASGCGEVTVHFSNNIPSLGNNGFSYRWDFGTGRTSLDENPVPETYRTPGVYPVHYQAVIDTSGHTLTNVRVLNVGCSDLFGRPDLLIEVYAPDNTRIYRSGVVDNARLPLDFNVNLPIQDGNYVLQVWDEDQGIFGGKQYEDCGKVTFNKLSQGRQAVSNMTVELNIIHPVDTVEATDTVRVFAVPDPPLISGYDGEVLCQGDTVELVSHYAENIQWYENGAFVIFGDQPLLSVTKSGAYQVRHTSPEGCTAFSESVALEFPPLPTTPVFLNNNNTLSLFDLGALPAQYALQWYFNGTPLSKEQSTTLCAEATGTYLLRVTDESSGCFSTYARPVTYNPDFAGCISTSAENRFRDLVTDVRLFPNPTTDGKLWLELQSNRPVKGALVLHNLLGATIAPAQAISLSGSATLPIDLSGQPAGVYFVVLQIEDSRQTYRVLKQ